MPGLRVQRRTQWQWWWCSPPARPGSTPPQRPGSLRPSHTRTVTTLWSRRRCRSINDLVTQRPPPPPGEQRRCGGGTRGGMRGATRSSPSARASRAPRPQPTGVAREQRLTPRAPEGGRERGRPGPPPSPGREGPPSPSSGSPGPLARCRWTCVRDHVHHRDVFVMAAVGPGGAAVRARVSRPARRGHRRRRASRAIQSWHAPSHMGGGGATASFPLPKAFAAEAPRSLPPPPAGPGRPPSFSLLLPLPGRRESLLRVLPPTGVGRRPAGPTRRCLVPRPRRGSSDSGTTA